MTVQSPAGPTRTFTADPVHVEPTLTSGTDCPAGIGHPGAVPLMRMYGGVPGPTNNGAPGAGPVTPTYSVIVIEHPGGGLMMSSLMQTPSRPVRAAGPVPRGSRAQSLQPRAGIDVVGFNKDRRTLS